MNDYKLSINRVCSLVALYLYCLLAGLQWSTLPQGHILMTSGIGILKLLVIASLFFALISSKPVFSIANLIAGAVFVLSLIITKDWHLIFFLLFAFALKDVRFDKVGITMSMGVITVIVVLFFLYRQGVAQDMISIRSGNIIRHSYGFNNTNHLGIVFSVFIVGILCFWFERLSAIKIAILAGLALVNYAITDSRAALVYLLVAFFLASVGKLFPYFARRLINIFIFIFPVVVVLVCVSFYTYTGGPIESIFDRISSGRFHTISQVFHLIPITAFQVPSVVKGLTIPFDCSYAYFLLVYGYVPAVLFFSLVLLGLYERNNNQKDVCLASVVVATLVYGLFESKLFDLTFSYPFVKVILDMPSNLFDIYQTQKSE